MSFVFRVKEAFSCLFSEAPLLVYAFFLISGIACRFLFTSFIWLVFLSIFGLAIFSILLQQHKFFLKVPKYVFKRKNQQPAKIIRQINLAFLLFFIGYLQTFLLYSYWTAIEEKTNAEAFFKIHSVQQANFYQNRSVYILKGKLLSLNLKPDPIIFYNTKKQNSTNASIHPHKSTNLQSKYKNLPCTVYYPAKNKPPSGNKIYRITGTVKSNHFLQYSCKAKTMTAVGSCFSLADFRFSLHKKIENLLRQKIKNRAAFIFFKSQLTGQMDNIFWRFIFNKTGMQHILAISGFHFMAVILFFSFIFKRFSFSCFMPWALLVITALFALYIGPSSSVQRAWIFLSAIFFAQIYGKNNIALNSLGLALIIQLLIDPLNLMYLSFQFSFLSVSAILFLYQPFHNYLSRWLKPRNKWDRKNLNFLEKQAAVLINYLRAVLAISLPVNLTLLPLILFYFHKFSYLGLIYNLFFPFLLTWPFYFALIALIFSLLTLFKFSFLSDICFLLADKTADFLLNWLAAYPKILDFSLHLKNIPWQIAALWPIIFIFLATLAKYHDKSLLNTRPIFR